MQLHCMSKVTVSCETVKSTTATNTASKVNRCKKVARIINVTPKIVMTTINDINYTCNRIRSLATTDIIRTGSSRIVHYYNLDTYNNEISFSVYLINCINKTYKFKLSKVTTSETLRVNLRLTLSTNIDKLFCVTGF